MARKALGNPVDDISILAPNHKPYTATIQQRLGAPGMRIIGKAFDKGVINAL